MSDLPIVPNPWRLKAKRKASKQFKIIRDSIGKAIMIVNAEGSERKGKLLVDEVLKYIGNKKPIQKKVLFGFH